MSQQSEREVMDQMGAALARLMAPRFLTGSVSQDLVARDTAEAFAQAREALNAYGRLKADAATSESTCDACAERKAGCVYENGDPNGATLCPDCVAEMTGTEKPHG